MSASSRTLLNAAIALAFAAALPAQAQTTTPAQTSAPRHYAIAPGPLAQVLSQFAAESDIVLSFDAAQLGQQRSSGLNGQFSVADGFKHLLAGTNLQWQALPGGAYAIRARQGQAAAPETVLRPVAVVAERFGTEKHLDRAMLDTLPSVNGDLSSQLKINPNIQFNESQLSSQTAGEIAPAEISIHGAKPYQNEFTIGGVSINNDLDPGSKGSIATNNPELIPGGSQALAIDASLLCDVRVHDSNVSAEYGRFTGGVVAAELCKSRKKLGGSVSVGYTSSAWTKQIIDPRKRADFENSSDADNQPNFRKWTYSATGEMRSDDDVWGLIVTGTRRRSEIELKRFSTDNPDSPIGTEATQTRTNDTLAIKADWSPKNTRDRADFTFMYAPSNNGYFVADAKDSEYTLKTGGVTASARVWTELDAALLSQQLSFMQNQQSRDSVADSYKPWRWSTEKNWGDTDASTNPSSIEGGFGDIEQRLNTWNYKLKSELGERQLGPTRHRITTGLDFKHQDARYARLTESNQYGTVASLPTTGNASQCLNSAGVLDSEACSTTPTLKQGVGQFFRRLTTYRAGEFDLDAQSLGLYAEDTMRWNRWMLRLGVRGDYDSLVKDVNIAPRSQLSVDLPSSVTLSVGANRYYGRSLMAYALQEKISTLKYVQTRTSTSLDWSAATQTLPSNRLEDIDSPYDDEFSFGALWDSGDAGNFELGFIVRNGRDQIVKRLYTKQSDCASSQCYVYTNQGGSTTKDLTLSWNSAGAWKLGPSETSAWIAANKSQVRSNYSTYADTYSSDKAADEIIQYDGQFIRYSDIPADNYNRPWTLRLGAITKLPAWQLTFTNVLRIRDGYQQILQDGTTDYEGTTVDVYKRTSLPRAITLDTVMLWTPKISGSQALKFKLTVENVTNRKNMTSTSTSYATYERGRTFALEGGYSF